MPPAVSERQAAFTCEYREDDVVGGVEGEQRADDGVAALERGEKVSRGQRFAARDSVLVGKHDPHRAYAVALDRVADRSRALALRRRPEPVALDESRAR